MAEDLEVRPFYYTPHVHLALTLCQARLKSHARAFEGLMSLIPAEVYYGKDASITSVCALSFCIETSPTQLSRCIGAMAEDEETNQGRTPSRETGEAGSRIAQDGQRCHGRKRAKTETRAGSRRIVGR
jgi:hypothetical protein